MTPDIVKLRETLPTLGPIIDRLELQLVDDPSWSEPSDTSYLSEADRQNPDIAANLDAMAETNKLIAWFGRDAEGYLGLWRGPNGRSLSESPVVRLDTEGQYSIVAATVPEYLAIAMPEDEFASTREALERAGFRVGFNPDAIWGALDAFDDDPNAYRNELYERYRQARGLSSDNEDSEDEDDGLDAVPEPEQLAAGSMPSIEAADVDERAAGDEGDAVDEPVLDETDEQDADDEDDDYSSLIPDDEAAPPPQAAAPPAKKPANKAAAKKPAKSAAAKKPAKKAAAKKPAKKAVAAKKPAARKAAAAKKPAAKKAAKKPAKPAKKAARKKR